MPFDLTDLRLFVHVHEAGSITGGAARSHLALPSASERIRGMESALGAALLVRGQRGVRLTAAGHTLLHHARLVLRQMEHLRGDLADHGAGLAGHVHLLCNTSALGEHLPPLLPAFLAAHPNLAVQLHLSERLVDLKNERFDLAIRIADLKSADLVAVKLARNHRVVCGSPAYLKRAGRPKALADLVRHNCLVTSTEDGVADAWSFHDRGKPVTVKVAGNLQCNDGEVLTRWALAGEGLALRSAWEVSEEVKKGRLVSVLDEFAVPGNNVYAVFPERRLLPAKVRFFIDHLKKAFGDPPYWE